MSVFSFSHLIKNRLTTLCLLLVFAITSESLATHQLDVPTEITPFPTSKLDEVTLLRFYPQVLAELEGELLHQQDTRTHRDTIQYGYSFPKLEKGDFNTTPIPCFLQELGDMICDALDHPRVCFNNVILSSYEEGFHLEPHVDTSPINHPQKPYYFGEKVYGIIIEADPTGHLYFVEYHDGMEPPLNLTPVYEVKEEPGLVFCLEGDYRNAPYFHGVSDVANRRISITFRTVVPKPINIVSDGSNS